MDKQGYKDMLAESWGETSKYKDIVRRVEQLIIDEPNNPLALWVLAEEEINLNNFNKAKILLNNLLLHLNPDSEEYKLVVDKLEQINR